MSWIESHQSLRDHPKVFLLADGMGWDIDLAIGKLHRLWWWCLDYAIDGDLRKHSHGCIGRGMGVSGPECDKVVGILMESGWLDNEPYLRIHGWWDYVGKFLQSRYSKTPEKWQEIQAKYNSIVKPNGNHTETIRIPASHTVPNRTLPTDNFCPSSGNPTTSKSNLKHIDAKPASQDAPAAGPTRFGNGKFIQWPANPISPKVRLMSRP